MATPRKFPCPKCNRMLVQSGELRVLDRVAPTFQCDECLMTVDIGGEAMEVPLTFVLDKDGRPIDPADPDNRLRF